MVENIIYYFSGTGNSLDVANHIAQQLDHTQLISMGKNPYEVKQKSSLRVGFVFPVYYGGMPDVVRNFIANVRLSENSYIFAVATGRQRPGNALKDMSPLFQSNEYHLSYTAFIKSADNNIFDYRKMRDSEKVVANTYVQLIEVIEDIKNNESNCQGLRNPCTSFLHKVRLQSAKKKERDFLVGEECDHCGICQQVCPVNNIKLVDGRPMFDHHCEVCMACIQYCPKQAINYKHVTNNKVRYHHPNIVFESYSSVKAES